MLQTPSLMSSESCELAVSDGPILPSSLSRRHLLAGGAAMGVAGKLSLLSAAALGASQAQAASATYQSCTWTSRNSYYIGTTLYEYIIGTAKTDTGATHYWNLSRRANIAYEPWNGICHMYFARDALFMSSVVITGVGNNIFSYTQKGTDTEVVDWPDTGTRRRASEIAWNLPAGHSAASVKYYEVPPEDSNEELFNGCSYLLNGVYYLKYTFRNHRYAWLTRPITTVTGANRTAIIGLVDILKDKARSLRIAKLVGYSTLAVVTGGIAAGATFEAIYDKANMPRWIMTVGITTFVVGGIALTASGYNAMFATSLAAANLIVKCEELYQLVASPV
jgi:hypothetical protein